MAAHKLDGRSWRAELSLTYNKSHGRSVIAKREHVGPLVVQKPFYPEGDEVCHTYILHPPGGVVGGDQLTVNIDVQADAHALLTTPASTKFYRCDDRHARQNQNLIVADNGILEWLPQDTILFDQAKVKTATRVELEPQARFVGWEILCLGRPASNELYDNGYCRQSFEIWRAGKPELVERSSLVGGSELLNAKWGMAGYSVMGLMVLVGANKAMLDLARSVESVNNGLGSVTLIDDILVCRCLARQGMEAREYFTRIWAALRLEWIGCTAEPPRIWNT
ncbi:Urease accessory protein UreD [hydrothermal vent metagenome]|uniref:Urease accessory protein UreD n=1 Tax=hydrothermal vent metagenome TaxID=652676 RepID=A0A3B1AJN2_9ZZZZ